MGIKWHGLIVFRPAAVVLWIVKTTAGCNALLFLRGWHSTQFPVGPDNSPSRGG